MELEKIICPDYTGRNTIPRSYLKAGDVVAFAAGFTGELRTGLMVISEENPEWFYWSVNLYKEAGRVWRDDSVPSNNIIFFEATKAEKAYALSNALVYESEVYDANLFNDEGKVAREACDAILMKIVALTE